MRTKKTRSELSDATAPAQVKGACGICLYTRRYTKSVADFLSAHRCTGRYLLTLAAGMAGTGAISIVANWEKFYQAGFSAQFWGQMLAPIEFGDGAFRLGD